MIGYACLNITLQEREGVTPARGCRLATLQKSDNPIRHCVELARQNLNDTMKILQWNKEHNIKMYRMSASMFPFATYSDYNWSLKHLMGEIEILGKFVRQNGMRVSSHLPQYINLGSPREDVVEKSFLDLIFQTEFLDMMELDPSHKIIIHAGGVYEGKEEAAKRFIKAYKILPSNVKKRLVVENDEKSWTIGDLIKIYEEIGIPIVIDHLHWQINHEEGATFDDDLKKALSTWIEKPKIHYAEQDPDKAKGAHAFYIKNIIVSDEFDTMVEAKGKELAILPFL